jgi:TRAP transporter 4TM/12TM fusion protein
VADQNVAMELADEVQGRYRTLGGLPKHCERILFVLLPIAGTVFILDLPVYFGLLLWKEQYLGFFLGLVLAGIYLGVVPTQKSPASRLPWYDAVLACAGLACGLYIAVYFPHRSLGVKPPFEPYLGAVAILLVLEATRRLLGWILVILAGVFILYAKFADYFPNVLYNYGVPLDRLTTYLYLDANGIIGIALDTAATTVLAFVFLGTMLFQAGGAKFFTEFAQCIMGRYRGGPAKISVVASGMFGSISGSAVANVMVDGWVTIPMMTRSGFRAHVAAAIEASASTGGIIMPPIMGAAAFLIAEFLAIPYAQVAIAALVPAILYFLVLFIQVDLEAAKYGLSGLSREDIPRLWTVVKEGWIALLTLAGVIYTLFILNMDAAMAAITVTLFLMLLMLATRRPGFRFNDFLTGLHNTGRALLDIGVITATAGLVIGVLSLMGLGFTLSGILVSLSGGNAFLLLSLAAVTCFVLGMGMPTTAAYVVLAVLVVPALTQLGVVPLAAHLFLLFFAKASMITPPVCLAAYAAASIGRCDPMQTGWASVRLSLGTFIAPFVFAFSPALILRDTLPQIALVVTTTLLGSAAIAVAVAGYIYRPLTALGRLVFTLGGLFLILPPNAGVPLNWVMVINTVGALAVAGQWFVEFKQKRASAVPAVELKSQEV